MALPVEIRSGMAVKLYRFSEPAPSRSIGLAWRRTSPRRADFEALAAIFSEIAGSRLRSGIVAEPELISLR